MALGAPVKRGHTGRAEMLNKVSARVSLANKSLRYAANLDFGSIKIGTEPEGRACPAFASRTMALNNPGRFALTTRDEPAALTAG